MKPLLIEISHAKLPQSAHVGDIFAPKKTDATWAINQRWSTTNSKKWHPPFGSFLKMVAPSAKRAWKSTDTQWKNIFVNFWVVFQLLQLMGFEKLKLGGMVVKLIPIYILRADSGYLVMPSWLTGFCCWHKRQSSAWEYFKWHTHNRLLTRCSNQSCSCPLFPFMLWHEEIHISQSHSATILESRRFARRDVFEAFRTSWSGGFGVQSKRPCATSTSVGTINQPLNKHCLLLTIMNYQTNHY